MTIREPKDIEALMRIGAIVAEARDAMGAAVAPGVSTAELDDIGRDILLKHGARSAPQLAYKFPGTTCISVNDALAHGIPSPRTLLRDGDIVNLDVSAELNGYWADTGASFAVGAARPRIQQLLAATRAALNDALSVVRAGAQVREVGRAVEKRARKSGFKVVRNLCGHGVGRFIHEDPQIPNTAEGGGRAVLHEGLVIAIEPFLTTGADVVVDDADGWTLRTPDGSIGAQFEHTVIITRGKPMIVTQGAAPWAA